MSVLIPFDPEKSLVSTDRLGRNWFRYRLGPPTPEGLVSQKSTESDSHPTPTSHARRRSRLHNRLHANPALSVTTKVVITTVGSLVVAAGLVMMVTPGPGIVGILVGLAILSTEYEWAARWLAKARAKAHEARVRAEGMDSKLRRRRLLLGGAAFLGVLALGALLVFLYGWPAPAVDGWDRVQGVARWVPDLPGM